jgi:hypothetical protein
MNSFINCFIMLWIKLLSIIFVSESFVGIHFICSSKTLHIMMSFVSEEDLFLVFECCT